MTMIDNYIFCLCSRPDDDGDTSRVDVVVLLYFYDKVPTLLFMKISALLCCGELLGGDTMYNRVYRIEATQAVPHRQI